MGVAGTWPVGGGQADRRHTEDGRAGKRAWPVGGKQYEQGTISTHRRCGYCEDCTEKSKDRDIRQALGT